MLGIDAGGVPITSSSQMYWITHGCHFPPRPTRFSSTWVGDVTVSVMTRFDSNSFVPWASLSFNTLDCWRNSKIVMLLLVATFFLQRKRSNRKQQIWDIVSLSFFADGSSAADIDSTKLFQLKKWFGSSLASILMWWFLLYVCVSWGYVNKRATILLANPLTIPLTSALMIGLQHALLFVPEATGLYASLVAPTCKT